MGLYQSNSLTVFFFFYYWVHSNIFIFYNFRIVCATNYPDFLCNFTHLLCSFTGLATLWSKWAVCSPQCKMILTSWSTHLRIFHNNHWPYSMSSCRGTLPVLSLAKQWAAVSTQFWLTMDPKQDLSFPHSGYREGKCQYVKIHSIILNSLLK